MDAETLTDFRFPGGKIWTDLAEEKK
jgi:L-fuconate dehydratase